MIAYYCEEGRIAGAVKKGKLWLIPTNAQRPDVGRQCFLTFCHIKPRKKLGFIRYILFALSFVFVEFLFLFDVPNVAEIKGLYKKYDTLVAVTHMDLEVKEGEVFGLLGPNGSGKSTTGIVNILACFTLFATDGKEVTQVLRRKTW